MPRAEFKNILLGGLAPDGGLVVPERYPRLGVADLERLRTLNYPALAFEVLSRFIGDIAPDALRALIARSYTRAAFGSEAIAPVTRLDEDLWLLELSNGPTLAFKDMAMQLLGNLFEHVLGECGGRLNILGATSGDTGSAAEYAMRGKRGVQVFMLSPQGKMSPFQTAQMYSLDDANIFNIAVRGVFDDCQDVVKAVSRDADFKQRHHIGTVNSINWARVAAQVVYYVHAWARVARTVHDEVSFCVPSGNFGNICAGHIARQMGLPVRRLILATNENDVLDQFFRSGVYQVRPPAAVHETSSPSMDISKASNFERFVFDLLGRDPDRLRAAWNAVERDGALDLSGSEAWNGIARYAFASGSSTHADRVATIRDVYRRYGRVIDPHTADGVKVGREHAEPGIPLICLETALPAKFEAVIKEALDMPAPRPPGFEDLEQRAQRCAVMDADVDAIKRYIAARSVIQ
jgi:threonine synthase